MSIEITIIVTIISASIALAGLIVTGQNSLRAEMRGQRKEMQEQEVRLSKEIKEQGVGLGKEIKEQGVRLDKEIKEQGVRLGKEIKEQGVRLGKEIKEQGEKHSKEITEVKVEVAALKATVDTYFRVRVDPPQQAAVAEPPEDYGAG